MSGNTKETPPYPVLGLLAVKHALIDRSALDKAMTVCQEADEPDKALADYLITKALVSIKDMKRLQKAASVMEMRRRDIKFGTIALEKRLITPGLLEMALDEQKQELLVKKRSRLLGNILVDSGMLTSRQRDIILIEQNRLKQDLTAGIDKPAGPGLRQASSPLAKAGHPPAAGPPGFGPELGPEPEPEVISEGLSLQVSRDRISVFLIKTDTFDENTTSDDILAMLSERNITVGIVEASLIDGFIRTSAFKKKPFRVARGKMPRTGTDAQLKFYFDTDRLQAGSIDTSGTMDFRNRGDIPQVEAGTLLAEKIPMQMSQDGLTVFGETVSTLEAQDITIKHDVGTELSEDGLKVIASIMGQPVLSWAGAISVLDEYITKGDVDYETGHLEFKGNIKVNGCVQNGFNVSGHTVIANEIDGGSIHAQGDVIISGGINEATIYARGNVLAGFILKSDIRCLGNIEIQKEVVDSTIDCSGALLIGNGKIIASRIHANHGVVAKDIGTERSTPSYIKTGVDTFINQELKAIELKLAARSNAIKKIKLRLSGLAEAARQLQEKTTNLAHLQDRAQVEIRDLDTRAAELTAQGKAADAAALSQRRQELKQQSLEAEKELSSCFDAGDRNELRQRRMINGMEKQKQLLEALTTEYNSLADWQKKNPGTVSMDVKGTLMAGTTVAGRHTEKVMEQTISRTTIKELKFTKPGESSHSEWWEMRATES